MNSVRTPLVFQPVYKDYIWGGRRIADAYGRSGTPTPCAESWEISAHPDGASVVAIGPLAGKRLDELTASFGEAITGARAPNPRRFPLLFKLIDARDRLSVQVHPNESSAPLTRGEPKTEMWVVLDRAPGASLFAGLASGVTPSVLRDALAKGSAENCLTRLSVEPGQALYIPGGLVHAIGSGCLIYEVQQSSNTTYRLYDWNRTGPDGKPRALHIEESFQTIDWSLTPPAMQSPVRRLAVSGAAWSDLVSSPFFTLRTLELSAPLSVPVTGQSFHALFALAGAATVEAGGLSVELTKGQSCLIPAAAAGYTLSPTKTATLLVTTL